MQIIQTSRIVYTKEELPIRRSWGKLWLRMLKEQKKYGYFYLLFGDWSGYRSSQYRITHIDYYHRPFIASRYFGTSEETKALPKMPTVGFTDNTTMSIWLKKVTVQDIIQNKWSRKLSYSELISKAIVSEKDYYSVKEEQEERNSSHK